MDKRAKDKLAGSPRENGGRLDSQKDLHPRTGRDKTQGKTQERMERGSRKISLSARSEKMERLGDRKGKMEGYFSTGQSPQWAVVPMEEEEERIQSVKHNVITRKINKYTLSLTQKQKG
jgi:hypothetical protein